MIIQLIRVILITGMIRKPSPSSLPTTILSQKRIINKLAFDLRLYFDFADV